MKGKNDVATLEHMLKNGYAVFSYFKTWLSEGRKELFYLTMHSTYFIYYYMDMAYGEETHCRDYMGYSFHLAARILLYAPSHTTAFATPIMEHGLE